MLLSAKALGSTPSTGKIKKESVKKGPWKPAKGLPGQARLASRQLPAGCMAAPRVVLRSHPPPFTVALESPSLAGPSAPQLAPHTCLGTYRSRPRSSRGRHRAQSFSLCQGPCLGSHRTQGPWPSYCPPPQSVLGTPPLPSGLAPSTAGVREGGQAGALDSTHPPAAEHAPQLEERSWGAVSRNSTQGPAVLCSPYCQAGVQGQAHFPSQTVQCSGWCWEGPMDSRPRRCLRGSAGTDS